jgi:acyl-CoA dehydrogenase
VTDPGAIFLTEEERLIQKTARDFADKVLAPMASEIDAREEVPEELIARMAELGFMGVLIPEEYGGPGLNNFCLTLIGIELNRVCASTGATFSVQNSLVSSPIIRFGTQDQKRRYLPKIAKAEIIGGYSLTEPESGSDAASLSTTAVKQGDWYILNGTKNFVTNGGIAKLFIIFARTHPDRSLRAKGISAFLVERDTEGLTVGKSEKKMGIRGSSTVELYLKDCKVHSSNLLGQENQGFKIAMDTLDGGRIGISSQAVGIAQACLDACIKYGKQRKQFGRYISEFQAIQWKLADMATEIEAARMLVYHASRLRDAGLPHTKEAAMAKLFSSSIANKAAREAVQVHGGVGYTVEFPVERFFRDAKITQIYEGTSEIQRIVIARQLLR